MELWNKNGKLISQHEWEKQIDLLRKETSALIENKKECCSLITEKLLNAIERRIPKETFCIFLSGGIDSSLLALAAKKFSNNFILVTIGTKGSPDMINAKIMANALQLPWKVHELSERDCEKLIKKTVHLLPASLHEPVSVGISAVVIAAVELAKSEGINYFIGGLGAEEIFAGYQRHLTTADVHEECWQGLRAMWAKDLQRDAALGKTLIINVATPFLDSELIKAAMRVPGKFKIADGERKVILREIAEQLGIPHEIAWRKKQAAQYGSGMDKMIAKLAKKYGYKSKSEYVKSIKTST